MDASRSHVVLTHNSRYQPYTLPAGALSPPGTLVGNNYYDGGLHYTRYFLGGGVVENTNNPGNQPGDVAPITNTFSGSLSASAAAQQCASDAAGQTFAFFSFDLHYLWAENTWICVQYSYNNPGGGYFGTQNTDVGIAYGYNCNGS